MTRHVGAEELEDAVEEPGSPSEESGDSNGSHVTRRSSHNGVSVITEDCLLWCTCSQLDAVESDSDTRLGMGDVGMDVVFCTWVMSTE